MIIAATFLAFVNERIIEYVTRPIFDNNPKLADYKWVLFYVALVTGAVLSFLAGLNLLTDIVPSINPLVGQIVTAIVVGGGSSLLHDLFPKDKP